MSTDRATPSTPAVRKVSEKRLYTLARAKQNVVAVYSEHGRLLSIYPQSKLGRR